jgi:hypothetical protein
LSTSASSREWNYGHSSSKRHGASRSAHTNELRVFLLKMPSKKSRAFLRIHSSLGRITEVSSRACSILPSVRSTGWPWLPEITWMTSKIDKSFISSQNHQETTISSISSSRPIVPTASRITSRKEEAR